MNKIEARKKYLDLRKKLDNVQIISKSTSISNNLQDLPIWEHNFYHIYLPIKEKNEVKSQRQAFENGLKLLNSNNQELLILRKEVEYYEENIDLVWKRRIRPEKLIQEKEEKIKLKRSIARGWQSTLVQIQKIYDTERQKYRDLSNKYDELKDDNENMPVPQGIKKEIDDRVTQLQNELNIAKEDIEFLKRKLNNNSLWEQRLKETGRQVRKSLRDYIVPPKN